MASPHNFTTIAERELEDPNIFLPISMRYEGENIVWTKPAYATYRGTPINHEMANPTILCNPNSTVLPPNMDKISKSENPTKHQKRYIHDYKFAAATIDHWKSTKHPEEDTLAEAIRIWKITCDKLTTNPFFSEGWFIPAFYPIYSYQCTAGIQRFYSTAPYFHPNKSASFWETQKKEANKTHTSWEAVYHCVASEKHIPFPKCLWYHRYHYIYLRKQPDTWKSFSQNSSFSEWEKIN
jgi:hypothetical protein